MFDFDANCLEPVMAVFGQSVRYLATQFPGRFQGVDPGLGGFEYRFFIPDAVFDEAYIDIRTLSDESTVSSVSPVLGVRVSWFVFQGVPFLPAQNDEVDIFAGGFATLDNMLTPPKARRYKVVNVEYDSHGQALLFLNKIGEWNGVGG